MCDRLGTKNVLLVSIHCNAAGADGKWKSAGGWCAYTSPGQTKADDLATCLYEEAAVELAPYIREFPVNKSLGKYDCRQRPIRTDNSDGDPDYEARFYILMNTKCPAILTESLFQDNKADVDFLNSETGKRHLTDLHVNGIINYINQQKP
ncbi:N-acetylmuramoyl-L-alanine amidase [Duncaniella muris]|uniref:N-acetylmuramoyl-L-alanine amidase n=1 Tax=Muribaculaceae TaxID=2005473 RepID=UPI003F4DC768